MASLVAACAVASLQAAPYKPIPVFTDEFERAAGRTRIPLHVDTGGEAYPEGWVVEGGIPIPKGEMKEVSRVRLLDANRRPVPFQVRPLAWWGPDSGIKWLHVQFALGRDEINPVRFLEYGSAVSAGASASVQVTETGDGLTADAGALAVRFSRKAGGFPDRIRVRDATGDWDALRAPLASYVTLRDIEGDRSGDYATDADAAPTLSVEQAGPASATVLLQSWHQGPGGRQTLPVDVRVTVFRDQRRLRIRHTTYFSENPAVTFFPAFGLRVPLTVAARATAGIDGAERSFPAVPVYLWQDSAAQARYPTADQFEPFCRVFADPGRAKLLEAGRCADGWIRAGEGARTATLTLRSLWQEYPKGFQVQTNGTVLVEFWPAIKPEPMDLRRIDQRFPEDYQFFKTGESQRLRGYAYNSEVYHRQMNKEKELITSALGRGKTHELWLEFGPADRPAPGMARAAQRPLLPFVTPAWNRFTGALGAFHPEDVQNFPRMEAGWELAWDTLIKHQRDWFNWYGMFTWGDFQSDYIPAEGRWSYYDTKYSWRNGGMDIPYSLYLWYLRSGKRKYYDLAEAESLQLMDVCTTHSRAWSDGRLMSPGWKGAGTSRYDMNHWGSGGGYDPEHCFAHSIQMHWLVTGQTHARDVVMDMATNYYRRCYPFIYRQATGQDTHYHGREVDMPARLAGNAYENDPFDPRWNAMLDFHLSNHAEGLRAMYVDADGRTRRRCNGGEVSSFYYTLYTVPALNYLLTVKDCPDLAAAFCEGAPLWRDEAEGGLGHHLLYLMTTNVNYAIFASRQAARSAALKTADSGRKPERSMGLMPHVMGGTWSTYPGLLETAVLAGLPLNPEQFDGRELNYYPTAEPGPDNADPGPESAFAPLDLRPLCNWRSDTDDGQPVPVAANTANEDPGSGPLRFDFGPATRVAPGCLPVTQDSLYPCSTAVGAGFSELPFGVTARFRDVPFALLPPAADGARNMLVVEPGRSYAIPVGRKVRRLHVLTGAALSRDPFHAGAGATLVLRYASGTVDSHEIVNMKHYQFHAFRRLYFEREFFAGRPNTFNVSVAPFAARPDDVLETVTIRDGGREARLCIFGVTAEEALPHPDAALFQAAVEQRADEPVAWSRPLSNGLYRVTVSCAMTNLFGPPLDVWVQGEWAVRHAVPVARSVYEIPVRITDGRLDVRLVPGEVRHKARAGRGIVCLHTVQVRPLSETGWQTVYERRPGDARRVTYGWRLSGERALVQDRMVPEPARTNRAPAAESLLHNDASYLDKYGIGAAEFRVDLPNGRYAVELELISWYAARGPHTVQATIQGQASAATIRPFETGADGGYRAAPTVVRATADVKDGSLRVRVALPPKAERSTFADCGISAMTIRQMKEGSTP